MRWCAIMNYIYIDESGDLGNDSNYLIMGAIITDDKDKLDRIIKKARRNYKRKLGNSTEIKGTKTRRNIKKKILKELNKIDYQLVIIVFEKKHKYKINYHHNNNLLYNIIASKLAPKLPITNKTSIIKDKSKNKEKDQREFNDLFLNNLNNPKNHPVTIKHEDSKREKGLQIADLLSWSAYQSIEHENDEFIKLITNKTIKKVFED